MHIVIAPNAFKNALSADDAANYIMQGLKQSGLQFSSTIFPIADGGDGTGDLLIKKTNASLIETMVHDPLGRKIKSFFGITENGTAIIELANASGIRLLKQHELNPFLASTFGTGELIKAALDNNATSILLCIGGSATVDGGTGILEALGVNFFDTKGNLLKGMPRNLDQLHSVDASQLDARLKNTKLIILCDVENELLGSNGSAAVFGPQKGATAKDVALLEMNLTKLKNVALDSMGKDMSSIKHGGAAGGVAASLAVFLNAQLVDGANYFLDYTNFDEALQRADIVITGEGNIDEQTLAGKAPYSAAKRAKEKGLKVIGLGGNVPLEKSDKMKYYFDELININKTPVELSMALKNTAKNLVATAIDLGYALALK